MKSIVIKLVKISMVTSFICAHTSCCCNPINVTKNNYNAILLICFVFYFLFESQLFCRCCSINRNVAMQKKNNQKNKKKTIANSNEYKTVNSLNVGPRWVTVLLIYLLKAICCFHTCFSCLHVFVL